MNNNTGSPAFISVSAGDIAERAYEIYVERGRIDGFDREDWLRAERELKAPRAAGTGGSRRRSRQR
jgi:DUF2934 family protein